jgi:hypothetical protein
MNFWITGTKVFAFIFLIFASFISTEAQTNSSIYQIPAGTVIRLRMDNEINSAVSSVNDTFTMTLAESVVRDDVTILPIGAVIEGKVMKVTRADFGRKNGTLEVIFQSLQLENGIKRNIEGELVNELKNESSQSVSVATLIGTTAIGGIIGAITKVKYGTLIGAGIGAGTGTGIALSRKGKNVGIKADEIFEIKLIKTVNLPVRDF